MVRQKRVWHATGSMWLSGGGVLSSALGGAVNNSRNTRRQSWITTYRVVSLVLLAALVVASSILLFRPAPEVPSAAEIAEAVNGPAEFQRPSSMEYVAKTNSCVVGGTVTSGVWKTGSEEVPVGGLSYEETSTARFLWTSFEFKSDEGRTITVSASGALWVTPGENLGLELRCDPSTMRGDTTFEMIAIIYGGK